MNALLISQQLEYAMKTALSMGKGNSKSNDRIKPQISERTVSPPRVVGRTGVSVRQQIAWAKAYKRFISKSSDSIGKKFRKEKSAKNSTLENDEEIEMDFSIMKPPAVFVDGYNIIGFTNSLKGLERLSNDLNEDRDKLINDLCVLRGVTGWAIEVIFDAYKAPYSSSSALINSRSQNIDGLVVTFTSNSETADNYIERRFEELRQAGFVNMVFSQFQCQLIFSFFLY